MCATRLGYLPLKKGKKNEFQGWCHGSVVQGLLWGSHQRYKERNNPTNLASDVHNPSMVHAYNCVCTNTLIRVINKYIIKTLNYRVLYVPSTRVLSDKYVNYVIFDLWITFEVLGSFWQYVLKNSKFLFFCEIQFVDILAVVSFCII